MLLLVEDEPHHEGLHPVAIIVPAAAMLIVVTFASASLSGSSLCLAANLMGPAH